MELKEITDWRVKGGGDDDGGDGLVQSIAAISETNFFRMDITNIWTSQIAFYNLYVRVAAIAARVSKPQRRLQ